jgi:hypothetical protein
MSPESQTLTTEEQDFLFHTVFPGLDARRETLDRDLFALVARRLLDAGYTADQLEQYIVAADQSRNKSQ